MLHSLLNTLMALINMHFLSIISPEYNLLKSMTQVIVLFMLI